MRVIAVVMTIVAVIAGGGAAAAQTGDPPAAVPTDAEIVGHLNAIRARMGVGAVTLDRTASDGCRKHDHYLALNPAEVEARTESRSKRGYTKEGQRAAATSAVNKPALDPPRDAIFAYDAPLHNAPLFDPRARRVHRAYAEGYDCIGADTTKGAGSDIVLWPPNQATDLPPKVHFAEGIAGFKDRAHALDTTGPAFLLYGTPVTQDCNTTERLVELTRDDGQVIPLQYVDRTAASLVPRIGDIALVFPATPLQPLTGYVLRATYVAQARCGHMPWIRHSTAAAYCTGPADDSTAACPSLPAIAPDRVGVTGPRVTTLRLARPAGRVRRGQQRLLLSVAIAGKGRVYLRSTYGVRITTGGPVDLAAGARPGHFDMTVDAAAIRSILRHHGGSIVIRAADATLTVPIHVRR